MKNKTTLISFLMLIILLMCACSNEVSQGRGTETTEEAQLTEGEESQARPRIEQFIFWTFDEFKAGISKDITEDTLENIEQLETQEFKGAFRNFIEHVRAEKSIYVPYHGDKAVTDEIQEGYGAVTLYPSDLQAFRTIHLDQRHTL